MSEFKLSEFKDLIGKTLIEISKSDEEILFKVSETEQYKMLHFQDYCESVTVEDVSGDLNDLLNTPILTADERTNEKDTDYGHETYTFYTLRTVKGTVAIRWYGESNGCYSESVDFCKMKEDGTWDCW